MKLPKAYNLNKNKQAGFTIIEVVVLVGIITVMLSLGLVMSMDFFRTYSFNYEQNVLASTLQKARSQALANMNQSSHGFCFNADSYVIFEGNSCATGTNKQIYPRSKNITLSSNVSEIVFTQVTGEASTNATVTITDGIKSATVNINTEGRIDW